MGINLKKLPWGQIGRVGLGIAESYVPGLTAAVRGVERELKDGDAKLKKVEDVSDQLLPLVTGLTRTEAAMPQIVSARSDVIEAIVALENAKSRLEAAKEGLSNAIEAVKAARSAPDATGHP